MSWIRIGAALDQAAVIARKAALLAALSACLIRLMFARPCDCADEREALTRFYADVPL
jgi:hypothetical protein